MQDRSKSYQGYGSSQSTPSGYTPYSSQTRISSYLGGSSETRSTPSPSHTSYGSEARSMAYRAGTNEIRGADIIAEYLVKEKVPYILGYAGHGAIGLLDGVYKHTDRIRHISPRIEQSAGFMGCGAGT